MQRREMLQKSGIAIATAVGVAGCGSSDERINGSDDGAETSQPRLRVIDHRLETGEFGNVAVVGVAENTTESAIGYAQIEAFFYDSGGTRLGSGLANINDLRSGRRWEFEAMYLGTDGERVESYELSVTA